MNKLSTDIVCIIKKYSKEIVKINKRKCLRELFNNTFWLRYDLKNNYKRVIGYRRVNNIIYGGNEFLGIKR
jgi:hypothetical protein